MHRLLPRWIKHKLYGHMNKNEISPVALIITFLLHFGLLYLALTRFPHHQPYAPYDIIHISIPVSAEMHTPAADQIDIKDLIVPEQTLITPSDDPVPPEADRYYLQQELSQQVRVLADGTGTLNVPIRQTVTMTLYINEAGSVDDVTIDDPGLLTDDEKKQLINGFMRMVFMPGMRGAKIVKSQYRIQLEINRRLIIIR